MPTLQGHAWTFRPYFVAMARPRPVPPSRLFRTSFADPLRGEIRITGRIGPEPNRGELLVVVHGLGGSSASYYAQEAARAAERAGIGCLRLNLRGADRSGDDIYHAGLFDDLAHALASPELAHVERIYLLGYSLGGHVVLRYASEGPDPRVAALATVCAPIDLAAGVVEIDKPKGAVYRFHVLRGLKDIYAAAASRAEMPCPVEDALRIRSIREWDERIVAPRFGFASADDYYTRASVGPHLGRIGTPSLVVVAEDDPMVFTHTVRPSLTLAGHLTTVYADRGGHVGFPPDLDLGFGHRGSVEDQVVAWLLREEASPR